jgi:predicted ATPase
MKSIKICNFGPIKDITLDLEKDIQIFIGAQATGKSTICKVVYFCKKIRDYTLGFLMDIEQFRDNHPNEYFNNYMKYLTRQFMGCFGKTTHMQKFDIIYTFGNNQINIKLNNDGFVRFTLDEDLKKDIYQLITSSVDMLTQSLNNEKIYSLIDNVTVLAMMKKQLKSMLDKIFNDLSEIIYIPAGRSLLASMSEQLQSFSITDMDLTMQEFINLIRVTKSKFGTRIPEIVKSYTKTIKGQINNTAIDQAYGIIKKILKADYTSESDGEKIYFDDYHWVKLMYGSSGQQEALWILMLSFVIILEKQKSFVIIEEPEAHLFPIGQKNIISLIALMVNSTNSQAIITTHSPYILTSLNILLYSGKIENEKRRSGGVVLPKIFRLNYSKFSAFKLENEPNTLFHIESIMDAESNLIKTDYIDEVSEITNTELEKLIDMEINDDMQ